MEGQIKATRTEEAILQEIESIINGVSKNSFLQFLGTYEEEAVKKEQLFFEDFLLDQIPEQLFNSLVEMDPENYFKLQEILQKKAYSYYAKATAEQITQYKQLVLWQLSKPGDSPSELLRIYPKRLNTIRIPVDKINSKIWRSSDLDEYITGSDNNIYVSVVLNFDKVGINLSKELNSYDKLIYSILATRYYSGDKVINLREIYKDLGNSGKAGKNDIDRINDSITKMGFTRVYINNDAEIRAGYKYPSVKMKYDCELLSYERLEVNVKGKRTIAIRIKEEPRLMKFARERGQTSTIPGEVLRLPINKNDLVLKLNDYLYSYICHYKKNKQLSNKLTFSTICKACNIPADRAHRQQRSRLSEKLVIILNHYKTCGFIKDFIQDQNRDITIIV